jgi:predicted secreted hydrolase
MDLSLAQALGGGDTAGYATAGQAREFVFPADHGAHPEFRNEWWYFTGRLESGQGDRYGFELTVFRVALWPREDPESTHAASAWRSRQVYFSHFAVTDVDNSRFHVAQRWSRGALGLAGVREDPLRIQVDGWSASLEQDTWHLSAFERGVSIELDLQALKPVVLNGDRGLSRKSSGPGQASYYYSVTRLAVSGQLEVPGWRGPVSGLAWLDREWSTSALAAEQVGWDWFALQLDDGSDLMLYQLRRRDGSPGPFSAGTLVRADGSSRHLSVQDFQVQVAGYWDSPLGGRYPALWNVSVPDEALSLMVEPLLADQELHTVPRYWEGAVKVSGRRQDKEIGGGGYVELTGYAQQRPGMVRR